MFQRIPPTRLLIYATILGLAPLFFVGFHYLQERGRWERVASHIEKVTLLDETQRQRQALNQAVRHAYGESVDENYLENATQMPPLLEQEHTALKTFVASSAYMGRGDVQERLKKISGAYNQCVWVEKKTEMAEGIVESEVALAHPVEMDASDLQRLLLTLEKPQEGAPQLLFSDLKCVKRETSLGSEVFQCTMKLIKREFNTS